MIGRRGGPWCQDGLGFLAVDVAFAGRQWRIDQVVVDRVANSNDRDVVRDQQAMYTGNTGSNNTNAGFIGVNGVIKAAKFFALA